MAIYPAANSWDYTSLNLNFESEDFFHVHLSSRNSSITSSNPLGSKEPRIELHSVNGEMYN